MTKITTENVSEVRLYHLSTFASDLGLPPGEWPERIPTDLGNKQDFIRARPIRNVGGEFAGGHYKQEYGALTIDIFND